jgi:hypothetical protein
MDLSEIVGLFHGTTLLVIAAIMVLTLVMIFVLAKYLSSDTPEDFL